jgi:mannose-1-phosphate guanylyltransferase/mannose-6-phosphate isomerase
MKVVIFAGGVGTRLWPLSRKKSPKQFEKIIDGKSTLQIAVERFLPTVKIEDIFISTGTQYINTVSNQVKDLPKSNIIGEPVRKDVGPAVCYIMEYIKYKFSEDEPVFISWSDHLVRDIKKFQKILKVAESAIKNKSSQIVFVGQKPRFPSVNLGYIEFDNKKFKNADNIRLHNFLGFKYKPDRKTADVYFTDNKHCWNLGYFITTPRFILNEFRKNMPQIFLLNQKIIKNIDKKDYKQIFKKYYSKMPVINFDNAILEQLDMENVLVIVEDIGWSDVGAWEALKEALEVQKSDNITSGKVLLKDSVDNLIYNYNEKKLIVGIDLKDMLIVNAQDVLLVTKKTSVSKIKTLVESFHGTEHEKLT